MHAHPHFTVAAQDYVLTNAAAAPGFSLKDEARWNSSHRSAAFDSGKKLRHLPIQFVSAGHLEGTIKEQMPPPVPPPESAESDSDDNSPAPSSLSSTQDNTDAMAHMAIRSPSPAASIASSSADEVVFQGRGQAPSSTTPSTNTQNTSTVQVTKLQSATITPTTSTVLPAATSSATVRQEATHVSSSTSAAPPKPKRTVKSSSKPSNKTITVSSAHNQDSEDDGSDADGVVSQQMAKRRGDRPSWEGTTTPWEHRSKPNIGWLPTGSRPNMEAYFRGDVNPRDAAMDDYMQNIRESGFVDDLLEAAAFSRREMDLDVGSHNDWESASGSQLEDGDAHVDILDNDSDDDSWDSDMLQDFDDMSTSDDVIDEVVRILRKRTRKSGLQYLCVYECSVIDDAHWLPATYLKRKAEKQLIRAFEEQEALRQAEMNASNSSDEGDYDEEESEEEEGYNEEELDDETLARVLQTQEELGLGSDEMVLYGGDEYFSNAADFSFGAPGRSNKMRQPKGRGNRNTTFPSASAMVDALEMDPYGGFDIMDTERPSLKLKKRGRRGQMPPELDDSDLNEQLQNAWEADRAKKRMKKAEREELRQQGLLGRKGKVANLKVKYSVGITMEDVVEELREFLLGPTESLSLPPMEAPRRATVHQAAKHFGLSSRSRGDGHDRFTVLSKTTRTRSYTDAEFDIAISRKGFLKRLSGPLQGRKGAKSARGATFRSGPRPRPQVGYRDGEKVGANAPELGPENKGHALMMKMGWTKGEALGTVDNQGILHPIAHTVKINKAGLK